MRWTAAGVLLFALFLAACSSETSNNTTATPTSTANETGVYRLFLAAADISVDTTRLPFVIVDPEGQFLEGDSLSVDLLKALDQSTGQLVVDDVLASYRTIEIVEPHQHQDGQLHDHLETMGVYVVEGVSLDTGTWVIQAHVPSSVGNGSVEISALFDVVESGFTPAVGMTAPKSINLTANDVSDLEEISTREPPIAAMYETTIGDAIDSDKPTLIAFSTPAFCQSRICGPVLESVVQIMPSYEGEVTFIHVEPFDLGALRDSGEFQLVGAAIEWNLPSEPWIFLVDSQGLVAAKFEGIVTPSELSEALDALLSVS